MRNRYLYLFSSILLFLLVAIKPAIGQQPAPADNYVVILPSDSEADIIRKAANVTPSKRQLRWQQLELTAFFHFGINTFTNKEWGNGNEDIKMFNPTELNAEQWVKTAKQAGIKQVILTAKHHDGFCLWPTSTTDHSVKNTPWRNGKGDVVKEVADACRKYGVGFGVYLSPWDMNSPLYGTEAYNDLFIKQLTELLSNYGRIDEVWFDGANGEGPNGKKQVYDFDRWYSHIRKLQPSATIAIMGPDVRWVGTETGYGRETEWSVVPVSAQLQEKIAAGSQQDITFAPLGDMRDTDLGSRDKLKEAKGLIWYPAETDVSIRPGWFYHPAENSKVRSPENLLDIYFNSVGKNGVLLLNLPPDTRGLLHENDVKSLLEWKSIRQDIFKTNLAKGAVISSANGKGSKKMLDGREATHFTTQSNDTSTVIKFNLKGEKTFNILLLQENIRIGQRIEKFLLEYEENGIWKKAAEGTTVGYKRLLRFQPVTSRKVRLTILSSRLNPTISEFGLFQQKN